MFDHAFVTSRIDYCNVLLAGTQKALTDKLHWLDVPERVKYKLVLMVHNCLHQKAPQYRTDCCIPISDVACRRHLRSTSRHHLVVLRHNLSTYGRRAFTVAGPAAWNSLSDDLRDPVLSTDSFRRVLKTRLFSEYEYIERIRGIAQYVLYKFTTYLLTYLQCPTKVVKRLA